MAFTREFIRKAAKESGVEIPKEFEDALVNEHISTRDAYASEHVKTAIEENKPEPPTAVKDSKEYKDLEKKFKDYMDGVTAKEAKAAKEAAVRAYYQSKSITGKALEVAMRGSGDEIESIELEDGKIKDTKALDDLIYGDFSGLVGATITTGVNTAHPPANTGGNALTKADIYKKDDKGRYVMTASERQKALIENKLL